MSAWEDIGSTYAEAASKAIPLHRAAIICFAFFASLGVQHQTHLSIIETITNIPLAQLTSFDKGILSTTTAGNLFWSLAATFAAIAASKQLLRLSYNFVERATSTGGKFANLSTEWLNGLSVEDRKGALDLVESGLIEPRTRLKSMTATNEVLTGLAITLIVATRWGNCLDLALGAAAMGASLLGHYRSIRFFIDEYLGSALTKAQLQGRHLPSMSSEGFTQ